MATVQYTQDSPYALTEMYGDYLDVMTYRTMPQNEDDVIYTVTMTYKHRPDMLAFDLYNNPNLWWVFQARNPNSIQDPIFDFIPGLRIYIPKQETLESVLGL